VATTFVALHIASYTKGFAAPGMWALEGLLSGVGVTVDSQRGRSGEGLVAGLADVSVLALGERSGGRWGDIVVVLPWVGTR
jgi:hypothetical protein